MRQASINREIAFFSAMCNTALKAGLLTNNVARGIKPFAEHKRTRILTCGEIERLLQACREGPDYLYPLVFTAVTTGARKGSLLALRWGDVDFDQGRLNLCNTKGGYQHRIPLPEQTISVLRNLPRRSEFVFSSVQGKPLADVRRSFSSALKRAKIEDMVFHALRHVFGSLLAQQGVDAFAIKSLLCHTRIDTSLSYVHISDQRLKQAVNLIPVLSSPADRFEDRESVRAGETGSHIDHIR